jgi:hypothetical protein
MDIQKTLADLRKQRDQVDAVIAALQTIYREQQETRRRGRPPNWLAANRIAASKQGSENSSTPLPKKPGRSKALAATSPAFGV